MLILEQVSMTVKVAVAVSPCGAVAGTGAHCVSLMTVSRFYGLGTYSHYNSQSHKQHALTLFNVAVPRARKSKTASSLCTDILQDETT